MGRNFERIIQPTRRDFLRVMTTIGGAAVIETATGCGFGHDKPQEKQQPKGEFEAKPAWEQDFSRMHDGPVDPAVWTYETDPNVPGYNHEAQGYTKHQKNVRIEDGRLVIEAHREPYTYPDDPHHHHYEITSGRIDTRDSLAFEYGKLEAELKLPIGEGTWPAFWMLSANTPYTKRLHADDSDERFYLHDGELDIMEAYGNQPGTIEATVHTYAKSQDQQTTLPAGDHEFHTYGVEITPNGIVWTLDGKLYYDVKKPSDNPDEWPFGNGNKFYAILNLAMGGESAGDIDPNKDTWRMEAKSIKFYKLTDPSH